MGSNGRHVVIVGSGHAGVQTAASLREEGFDGTVTLVSEEADLPYHKPPLSKAFIKDEGAEPQILRAEAYYTAERIDLRLGARAEKLDLGGRRLELVGGGSIGFDALILATGSRARRLALPGADLRGVLSLRSLADARVLRTLSRVVEDVVILGGGFIGLEVAATLAASGRRVTVLEAQTRLLARAVAPEVSAHVAHRLTVSGVRIVTGVVVEKFDGSNGAVEAVVMVDGTRLAAGMVVVGVGAQPNVELAASAGIATANGIPVDATMRSAIPDILAIGDLALYRHWQTGTDLRLESVQNAHDQARTAARSVLGHREPFRTVPWFWSDTGDMKLQMVGLASGGEETVVLGEPADNRFALFRYRDEKLVCIETVNRPADHMLGRRMIAEGFSPDKASLAGTDLKAAFAAWLAARSATQP